ncbi:peptidoglycan editing factor PgeF [Leucothrix sargassi]|nr:peptidoglycan editing factor PgeF [Leucothrix sargassi]
MANYITPNWPAPANVKAVMTTRKGGFSQAPFDSMNLGDHVSDDPLVVSKNRSKLMADLQLPNRPVWLTQVHGTNVVSYGTAKDHDEADAIIGSHAGDVCAIMTADCLPVIFCDRSGNEIAAAHAGWRGLAASVLEQTMDRMHFENKDILVWMGAAISQSAFEVGDEVKEVFIADNPDAQRAFKAHTEGKWLADIYQLARMRLIQAGVQPENIYGGEHCTYTDTENFYSYRRENRTGRMATLIWMTN